MLGHTLILLSLSLLGATSAIPAPSATNSLLVLASRGIDPTGPIPADATPLAGGGGYSFAADSDTAHWVLAAGAIPASPAGTITKRDVSGLSISMWSENNCSGQGSVFNNVAYSVFQIGIKNTYTSSLYNGRALLTSEQLDYYSVNTLNGDACGIHVQTAANRSPAGCHGISRPFGCLRLTKH